MKLKAAVIIGGLSMVIVGIILLFPKTTSLQLLEHFTHKSERQGMVNQYYLVENPPSTIDELEALIQPILKARKKELGYDYRIVFIKAYDNTFFEEYFLQEKLDYKSKQTEVDDIHLEDLLIQSIVYTQDGYTLKTKVRAYEGDLWYYP